MSANGTRTRLIEAAEQLFAERGVDAVSLREINVAADQRNTSAVHYHFGSKQALIDAIFGHRMPAVDRERGERLRALEEERRGPTLRDLVCALVYPLAEQLDGSDGGSQYVGFLAQLERNPREGTFPAFHGKYDAQASRVLEAIQRELGDVPPAIRSQRLRDVISFYVRALGDREREARSRAGARRQLPLPLFVANLADTIVGMLSAPVSDAAFAELKTRRSRPA